MASNPTIRKAEPTKVADDFVIGKGRNLAEVDAISTSEVDTMTRDDLLVAMGAHMAEAPPEYTPPKPTARQSEQTRLEMEAGAKRVAAAEAQKVYKPEVTIESTPVFRPNDHVPSFDSKSNAARGHRDI